MVTKQSSSCHWHPILGWFSQQEDSALHESLTFVRKQLSRLWDIEVTEVMFLPLQEHGMQMKLKNSNSSQTDKSVSPERSDNPLSLSRLRKVIDRASAAIGNSDTLVITKNPDSIKHLNTNQVILVSSICSMYSSSLSTMTQIRLEILTGLCYNESLIKNMWKFLSSLDDRLGLITFLELVSINTASPELKILTLFCECATHLIT